MHEISFRQLEYFVAAAETGTVTAAAAKVHLTQSAVSTSLAELEENLGVQLFLRHARGLKLTAPGRQALADARRLLSGVDELRDSARETQTSLSGSLVVGCYSTLAAVLLPRVIAAFVAKYPDVDLSFIEGSDQYLAGQLRSVGCDIALMYEAPELTLAKDLRMTALYAAEPYVLLPAHHRLAAQDEVSMTDLAAEPMVLFDLPPGATYFLSLFKDEDVTPNVRYRATNFEMARSLVAHGLGYSVLTQHPGISISYDGIEIATRPLTPRRPGLNVGIVRLTDLAPSRRATAFAEQCAETLGGSIDFFDG
ncbi:LysR family transcriptional regulator [Streptomyces sp. SID10853]|uniref:LysR family transcriptional regulator n=1 Tax=Streptomyces sp. SID10853 TaxID=2706028 RepID=UPI0013C0D32E|nr:LysR family transcriptional regulator [Streptomyces sp. SID10853]NDZ77311.1 LysR family transcriptional regulator [Streptomyces sp. SID10853]